MVINKYLKLVSWDWVDTTVSVQPDTVSVQPDTVFVQPDTVSVQPDTVSVQPDSIDEAIQILKSESAKVA